MTVTMVRDAQVSEDGVYRYVLNRRWAQAPTMPWIGLNPSIADDKIDDPTVKLMCGFAAREGYGGICLLNLYALRATDPKELRSCPDPVGPDNDRWLRGLVEALDCPVTVAWGAHPEAAARTREVLDILGDAPLVCLGTTKRGQPRHPLYLGRDTPMVPWRAPS